MEIKEGRAAAGDMGDVLRKELARAGIGPSEYFIDNLWKHPMPERKSDVDQDCYEFMIARAVEQMENMKYVLLCGSENAEIFLDDTISAYSSLEVNGFLLPQGPVYYAMMNPAYALRQSAGEIRLAITKLSERMKDDSRQ